MPRDLSVPEKAELSKAKSDIKTGSDEEKQQARDFLRRVGYSSAAIAKLEESKLTADAIVRRLVD